MLEYASMRFTFACASATTLPPVIVTAARSAKTALQSRPSGPSATIIAPGLAADEHRAEVGGESDGHVADGREQERRGELARRDGPSREVVGRDHRREHREHDEEHAEERGERVDDDEPTERGVARDGDRPG